MKEQKYLFEILKSKIPDQHNLADIVEELLGVSIDSAYRRIRGEKELSISELIKICKRFHLSIDEILKCPSDQGAFFSYGPVFYDGQENCMQQLKQLVLVDEILVLKQASEKELLFSAQDIPSYHYANFPELAFFKLFVWNDMMNRNKLSFNEFCDHLQKDEIMSWFQQMHQAYMFVPSKEVWNNQTIDVTLRLIEYYYETGTFDSKDTAVAILDQLNCLMDTVKQYAEDGYKDEERKTPFTQYLCLVALESNFFVAKNDEYLSCTLRLNTINFLTTNDESICCRTIKCFDDLVSKSIQISTVAVRERYKFYQSSKNKIDSLIEKIKM